MASNVSNFRTFSRQLDKALKAAGPDQLVVLKKKITFEVLSRALARSPRDRGNFIANWRAQIGVPATAPLDGTGTPNLAGILGSLTGLVPFQVVYVNNTAQHGHVIDSGGFDPANPGPSKDPRPGRFGRILVRGGYSTQAPQGITTGVVAEILALFP